MTTEMWYDDETCIDCGEPLDHTGYPEDSEYVGEYGSGATYEQVRDDGSTGYWCLYCREDFDSHANTLVLVAADGRRAKVEYSGGVVFDHGIYDDDFVYLADHPHEEVALDIVSGTGWRSTDAWRGYEDGPSEAAGWTRVKDSWHGTMMRTDASDRINDLSNGDGPAPVAVAFTRTSNVMSLGIEVYAPERRADDVRAFFEGASAGLDGGRF